jgi:hypothetical protein
MIDFLCVGAHKAGTTWLHANLKKHPDIWLPPFKELHHFDQKANGYTDTHLFRRLNWLKKEIEVVIQKVKKSEKISSTDYNILNWAADYALTNPDDRTNDWYLNLFNSVDGVKRCTGDITPSYALLTKNEFKEILEQNPDIKIIFMMRKPADRIWSSYRFDLLTPKATLNQKMSESYSFSEFKAYAQRNAVKKRTDYLYTVNNLNTIFSEKNVKYIFFEEFTSNPEAVLSNVCDFLDIEFKQDYFSLADEKQLVSTVLEKPIEVDSYLEEEYWPMLQELNQLICLPEGWLK